MRGEKKLIPRCRFGRFGPKVSAGGKSASARDVWGGCAGFCHASCRRSEFFLILVAVPGSCSFLGRPNGDGSGKNAGFGPYPAVGMAKSHSTGSITEPAYWKTSHHARQPSLVRTLPLERQKSLFDGSALPDVLLSKPTMPRGKICRHVWVLSVAETRLWIQNLDSAIQRQKA